VVEKNFPSPIFVELSSSGYDALCYFNMRYTYPHTTDTYPELFLGTLASVSLAFKGIPFEGRFPGNGVQLDCMQFTCSGTAPYSSRELPVYIL